MGLFGADWSWDEWQKKEEFYGELDKQTDKLINGLKSQQDERDYQQLRDDRIRAMNDYANSLSKDDHRLIKNIKKESRRLSIANIRTNILCLNFDWSVIQGNDLRFLLILITVPVFILSLLINPFKDIGYFYGDIYLILNIIFWTGIYRVPCNLIQALHEINGIRKTNCFKELIKDLEKTDFSNVEYIGVSSSCVRIINKKGYKSDYKYASYDFPNLPYKKYGILLAAIIWHFKLVFRYKANCMTFRKDETCYLYGLGDRSVHVGFGCDYLVFSEEEQKLSGLELFNYSVYAKRIIWPMEKLRNKVNLLKVNNVLKKEEAKKRKAGKTW